MRRDRRKSSRLQGFRALAVGIIVTVIVASSLYLWAQNAPGDPGPRLAIDWRLTLTIQDRRDGMNYTLPAGIGVPGQIWFNNTLDKYGWQGYAPVSTRDNSGTIYIQSPRAVFEGTTIPLRFTFGDFFNIWGQPFDRNCVPDGRGGRYCGGEGYADPAPVMLDVDMDDARCISRGLNLSHGKNWVIILGAPTIPELNCA